MTKPSHAPQEQDTQAALIEHLLRDNKALRDAGNDLAVAALMVVRNFDGVHRLSMALSTWTMTLANEGGRGERFSEKEGQTS